MSVNSFVSFTASFLLYVTINNQYQHSDAFPQSPQQSPVQEEEIRTEFYAKRLLQCQQTQGSWSDGDGTEMASCLKDIILSVTPKLRDARGLPELGLPRVDPFDLHKVEIAATERGFSGNFTNLRLFGVTNGLTPKNLNITVNPKNLRADLHINIPNLRLEGDYQMSINFMKALFPWLQGFPSAESTGKVTAHFETVEAKGLGLFREASTGTGVLGVFLERVGVDFDFHEGNFKFQSDDPNNPFITLLNGILKDPSSGKALVNEIKPEVIQTINKLLYSLMSKGLLNLDRLLTYSV